MTPESRILSYIVFAVALFIFPYPAVFLAFGAGLCILLVRLPLKSVLAGWIPISLFLAFTFASNLVGRHGEVLLTAGPLFVTRQGLDLALLRCSRLLLMIGGVKAMMGYSNARDIVRGLGRLMAPFEKMGLPVADFFHTMGLTLQCLPGLRDMATALYRERMTNSDLRGFWQRATAVSGFLLPMFIRSMQRPEAFFAEGEGHGEAL